MQEPTGREYSIARTALGITQRQLADAAQRRHEWVSRVESRRPVPSLQARRYREALARCITTQLEEGA